MNWRTAGLVGGAALVFLGALSAINSSWMFLAPSQWIDPFLYTGYSVYGGAYVSAFKDLYYTARLPAIAPAWIAHALLVGPLRTAIVLRIFVGLLLALGVGAGSRAFSTSRAAPLLAVVVALANPYVLWAIGWDYVDGISLAYLCLTLGTASLAVSRRSTALAALAGMAYALTISTYVMLVVMTPVVLMVATAAGLPVRVRQLLRLTMAAAAGFFAAVLALGCISVLLGGHFLYFMPQLKAAVVVSNTKGVWKAADYTWVAHASWLLLPGAVTLASGLFLAIALVARLTTQRALTVAQAKLSLLTAAQLVAAATFVIFELSGFWLLQYSFYAVYLCGVSTITLAALWVDGAHGERRAGYAAVLGVAGCTVFTWLALSSGGAVGGLAHRAVCAPDCLLTSPKGPLAPTIFLGGLLAAAGWGAFRTSARRIAGAAALSLSLSGIFMASLDSRIFHMPDNGVAREEYQDLVNATRAVRVKNPAVDLYFWFDAQDQSLGDFGRALASTHLYGYRLVSDKFPSLAPPFDPKAESVARPGLRVAVLTSGGTTLERARAALAQRGLDYSLETQIPIRFDRRVWPLYIIKLKAAPSPPPGGQRVAVLEPGQGEVSNGAAAHLEGDAQSVTTARQRWAYSYDVLLPKAKALHGPGLIRLRLLVRKGEIGVGLVPTANARELDQETLLGTTSDVVDVRLPTPNLAKVARIVLRNTAVDGPSEVLVQSIEIYRSDEPSPP